MSADSVVDNNLLIGVALLVLIIGTIGVCSAGYILHRIQKRIKRKEMLIKVRIGYKTFANKAMEDIAILRKSAVGNESGPIIPRSGIHVANIRIMSKTNKGRFIIRSKFTAEYTLSFLIDEQSGEGYFITGKRVDTYGQTTIEKGYLCHSGDAFWIEKFIASNAQTDEERNANGSKEQWYDPCVTDAKTVMKGKFIGADQRHNGKTTFSGDWFCEHADLPCGRIKMASQGFGREASSAGLTTTSLCNNMTVLQEEAVVRDNTIILAQLVDELRRSSRTLAT